MKKRNIIKSRLNGKTMTAIIGNDSSREMVEAAMAVGKCFGIKFEVFYIDPHKMIDPNKPFSEELIASVWRNKMVLKGAISTVGKNPSPNLIFRDLFALDLGIRPAWALEGVDAVHPDTDVIGFRKNTEGGYSNHGGAANSPAAKAIIEACNKFAAENGSALLPLDAAINIVYETESKIEEYVRLVFENMKRFDRKSLYAVYKHTIQKHTGDLYINTFKRIHKEEYPQFELLTQLTDANFMLIVKDASMFDCIAWLNDDGDKGTDGLAGATGGLGYAAGINVGTEIICAECVGGTAPKHAGKDTVNPCAMDGSLALEFLYCGFTEESQLIMRAIEEVTESEEFFNDTDDEGVTSTKAMTEAICDHLYDNDTEVIDAEVEMAEEIIS